jgi:hypothetical protein
LIEPEPEAEPEPEIGLLEGFHTYLRKMDLASIPRAFANYLR